MSDPRVPFNKPVESGQELKYIQKAIENGQLAGDGFFTQACEELLLKLTAGHSAHLTHSCTAALEMAAILCNISAGDEVIMPSYTFVSTANAVVLRGGVPVFVDIEANFLNIDPDKVADAITPKTKAIWPVHYAGVIADMNSILELATDNSLLVVEDAAQALGSKRDGKLAGSFGDFSAFSFHETKNVISGEGGALIVNKETDTLRAEIIREKGTNRRQFFRGMVDKYSWVDIGSSFLPGELIAAFLLAQLEASDKIMERRMKAWSQYDQALNELEKKSLAKRINIPSNCTHNAHMYYIVMPTSSARNQFINHMRENNITTPFHYVPLHSSKFGRECSRSHGAMNVTDDLSQRVVRMPLYPGVDQHQEYIIDNVMNFFLKKL